MFLELVCFNYLSVFLLLKVVFSNHFSYDFESFTSAFTYDYVEPGNQSYTLPGSCNHVPHLGYHD